jgi:DNA polymerase sigma
MSHIKGNNESTSKGKIYQTKTVSDKNLPTTGNELTLTLYLNKLIEQYQIKDIEIFIEQEKPSPNILNVGISLLLKKYNSGDDNFYKLLDLLLQSGASPNNCIAYNSQENPNIKNISEKDNVSLLMFGIMLNDIEFINIILKYNPNINQHDSSGRSAIIYAIIYNHNDSTKILNLLIKNNANINYSLKIHLGQNQYEYHSVFTLACYYDLPRITKCLLDNYVDVDFKVKPSGDTGLHICTKYGKENTLQVLLSCDRINPNITNKEGKLAVDLIPDNERKNDIMKLFINFYNNMANKNKNNNGNNYNFQQINKKYVNNNINNEQQNNNINNNMNMNNNFKGYINNVNMMSNNSTINNNIENNSQNIENNTSNDSSYLSDELDVKDKNKNIKKYQKNNFYSQYSFKLLNKKIYNSLLSKKNENFNIEIPIEIIKKKKNFSEKYNTLNNFISPKINATPLLNLDITNKCFDLEIKLNELKLQLQENIKKEAEYKAKNEEKSQILEEKNKILEQNNLDLEKINTTIIENEKKINQLKETQQELKNKIPQDKLYQKTNKGNKFYKELKFMPYQIEDTEMFKILNKDLMDYQKYITEKINKKIPLIYTFINEIKEILNEKTQDYEIQIYGSYANGLCMPWSDLDLVLVNKNSNNYNNFGQDNNNNEDLNENILLLQNNDLQSDSASVANTDSTRETANTLSQNELLLYLLQNLKNKSWIKQQIITENLSVKILRIITIEAYSEMNIDISIETEKHNGLKCVNLVKSYLKEYSALKPITIALKAILQSANLHNPNKGGLSSYGLILMVVSYIQSQKDNFDLKNEPDLNGKIFYGFLKHYGILFDFNKYLILTYPANEANIVNNDKESYLNINQFSQEFIILDPLNNKNNVANSSFQFMNLKMAFMIAFMVTKEDCDCGCHYGKAVYENSFNSTEHSYLKRMLNSVRRFQG